MTWLVSFVVSVIIPLFLFIGVLIAFLRGFRFAVG
jgi:hypothetical protein